MIPKITLRLWAYFSICRTSHCMNICLDISKCLFPYWHACKWIRHIVLPWILSPLSETGCCIFWSLNYVCILTNKKYTSPSWGYKWFFSVCSTICLTSNQFCELPFYTMAYPKSCSIKTFKGEEYKFHNVLTVLRLIAVQRFTMYP